MKPVFSIILLFILKSAFSQKTLDFRYRSVFGREKHFQFFNNSKFTYREKGKLSKCTKLLTNMQDSILVFSDGTQITFNSIAGIKIKGFRLSPLLFGAGGLFLFLDSFHNVAFGKDYIVSDGGLIVCGSFMIAGIITHLLQDVHINSKRFLSLQVLDPNFEQINKPQ